MNRVAIITARGGSKRIPHKNIKHFLGKPVIAYSIEAAINSGLFAEVMVSTDDEKIAAIALELGATVPFYRSAKNSDDFATTVEVINEVLDEYEKRGKHFEYGCCLYPTAPFITSSKLEEGFTLMLENKFDVVFPVSRFSYPIWRALEREDGGKTQMFMPENLNKRSQDLIPAFHDAGQFYWFETAKIKEKQVLFTDNTGSIELSELEVQDIDNETDWQLAELKYKLNKGA